MFETPVGSLERWKRNKRGFSDMLVRYMRVPSDNDRQTADLQRNALLAAGVAPRHLFADKASGARDDRPGLQQALDYVRPGDCLVGWKLDRLGRLRSPLFRIITTLQAQGVAFRERFQDYADYLVSIEQEHVLDRIATRLSQMRARLQRSGSTP